MDKQKALEIVWEYMQLHHRLKPADAILVLGNRDTRVAEHAAMLWLEGWAPYLLFSGSGSIHNDKRGREQFKGTTEAEVFANVAKQQGVPNSAILIENKSQNTGENYQFSIAVLHEQGIKPTTLIAVQKPYMERRTYATGKIWLPTIELIVTSPPLTMAEYPNKHNSHDEYWIHAMVGDLERIITYPERGYQIYQEVPDDVLKAFTYLVSIGYTKRLVTT